MKNSWKLLLVLISLSLVLPAQFCNPNDNCVCYPKQEIHCPSEPLGGEKFIIHLEQKTRIDCFNMKTFRMDLLPNVTSEDNDRLEINNCPLPDHLKKLVEHFSMNETKVVSIENWNGTVILTKNHFRGLDLSRVKLNGLNFGGIEDEVFSDLSNLNSLDMERNINLTLTAKNFQNLKKLILLYLTQNGLKGLPEGLFDNLGSLEELDLGYNNLGVINQDSFSGLSSLTYLNLSVNEIENISEKSFQQLKKLKFIDLGANKLEILSADVFRNNTKLKDIFLDYNPGLQFPDYFFANFKTLETVHLSYCNFSYIPEHSFENSTNLRMIDLHANKLTKIPPNLFQGLLNLRKLYLYKNLVTEIDNHMFQDLSSLEKIDISKNLISTIQYGTFYGKRKLQIINLHQNQYSGKSGSNILEDASLVRNLNLSHNLLTKVEHVFSPHSQLQLQECDLRNNQITEIWLTHLKSTIDMRVYLDHNNITKVHFDNIDNNGEYGKSTISLFDNALECTCDIFELTQFLRVKNSQEKPKMFNILTEHLTCGSPQKIKGHNLANLSQAALVCDFNECPLMCSCNWRPFDKSIVIDCQNKNLTQFPIIGQSLMEAFAFNQTELHLEGNYLESGPNMNLEGYNNVTKLYLSNNRIQTIEKLPPQLEILHLDNNRLRSLDFRIIDILSTSKLVNLTLHKNDWLCDCNSLNFTKFLLQHSNLVEANNIKCRKSIELLLIELTEVDLCNIYIIFYILVPVLVIMFVFMMLAFLFSHYQQEIKVWLFAHDWLLWWVTEEELDKNKRYDAFLSYSHRDGSFVEQKLVSVLESGPTPYKLCLHDRDWIPGEFISAQITESVLQSRRTLIVLSPNFLESVWGKMEFRTAHTHAMTEGRTSVIIVVYGDIDTNDLDDELKSYMRTNTYVKWGDPNFWDKLRYALPHSTIKFLNKNPKLGNTK